MGRWILQHARIPCVQDFSLAVEHIVPSLLLPWGDKVCKAESLGTVPLESTRQIAQETFPFSVRRLFHHVQILRSSIHIILLHSTIYPLVTHHNPHKSLHPATTMIVAVTVRQYALAWAGTGANWKLHAEVTTANLLSRKLQNVGKGALS